ncbi:MAG: SET domain-containing protein-lysine N-methyltransferase [Opitutaceae bacterium]|nr:SET domain-containing protein-lysine N-methyltransferase [Opitutaceae bacterium]
MTASRSSLEPPLPPSWVIRRGRSRIHGSGVYARVAIPAGYVIIEYRGERITKAESRRREIARLERVRRGGDGTTYIFRLNARHDLDGRRGGNLSRYINHSCDPNCRADKIRGHIFIIAERDIARGEELSFDYGYGFRHWELNPCRCGAAACAGFIVAADQRWRLLQARAKAARSARPR